MPDGTLYSALKTGRNVAIDTAICKIVGVNDTNTIAISGTWSVFPEEENFKTKRILDGADRKIRTGTIVQEKVIVGYNYMSTFNQRDAATLDLDLTYAGSECLLLVRSHYFRKLGTPAQQWIAIFGTVAFHDGDVTSEDGKSSFLFTGLPNTKAIEIVPTAGAASGKITAPTITGYTQPASTITIPAYAPPAGIYKITDI